MHVVCIVWCVCVVCVGSECVVCMCVCVCVGVCGCVCIGVWDFLAHKLFHTEMSLFLHEIYYAVQINARL